MNKILDLGCGNYKLPGSIGVDSIKLPAVDIVHNLNEYPYPFNNDHFDEVYLRNIIEHVANIIKTMEEVYRITKNQGIIRIFTPHFSSHTSWTDPTHLWHLGARSFDFFCRSSAMEYYSQANFSIEYSYIKLNSVYKWLGIEFLINLENHNKKLNFIRKFWEKYLCFIIRARFMEFHLRVLK